MFNAEKVTKEAIKWIQDWFEENGKGCNAVIAISGGKDSSVVAALCVEALGRDRVFGVLMPNGEQKDIGDSLKLVEHLQIKYYIANNISTTDDGNGNITLNNSGKKVEFSDDGNGNIKLEVM